MPIPELDRPFEAPPAQPARPGGADGNKAAPPGGTPTTAGGEPLGALRSFRAELQGLIRVVEEVRAGNVKLDYYTDFLAKVRDNGDKLLAEVEAGVDPANPDVDEIRELRSAWEQLKPIPIFKDGAAAQIDEQERLQNFGQIEALCRQMIAQVGHRTIPARLAQWLDRGRPGYYVPFHLVFADELPNEEDRTRLLQHLAWSPRTLANGLVDAGNGLIYRYSEKRQSQALSAAAIVALFAVFTAVAALLPWIVDQWGGTRPERSTAIGAWIAVLLGVIVHMAVDLAKRIQSERQAPPVLAAADVLPRINARAGMIAFKLVLALIGVIGLAAADRLDIATAFLAGYSLDSVVDLFGTTLEGRSTAVTAKLKTELAEAGA